MGVGRGGAQSLPRRGLGFALLGVGAAAAVELSLRHLGAGLVPGCALDSPCQRALSGPFGTIPALDWPVAFVGASYFVGLLGSWSLARDGWPRALAWVVRAGALVSLGFIGLALRAGTLCPFCLAAQLANLAFLPLSERSARGAVARRPLVVFVLTTLVVSALLAFARGHVSRSTQGRDEGARADSTRAIAAAAPPRAFTGRYGRGPAEAALRIVLFSDYQCPDCARIEAEASELAEARADVSLSLKHFPLCKDCNRRARELGQNPHPNACWAARAAEAAGIVGGTDGFWRMQHWLLARGGAFVEADLRTGLAELELDPGPFIEALNGAETLARVQSDVEEALALGIQSTPMVFVNGVELRGWRAPRALSRTLEELAATHPSALGPAVDHPPGALAKALEDWRQEPRVALPGRAGSASSEIVLWGDFFDSSTRELDQLLRAVLVHYPGARYAFRHYPLDPECVPTAPPLHPGACRAARAVEAAREIGGDEAAERLHIWFMGHDLAQHPGLDDAQLRVAGSSLGLDPDALLQASGSSTTRAHVDEDVAAARALGITSIPLLYVDGRRVPRWRLAGEPVLERILAEALAPRATR